MTPATERTLRVAAGCVLEYAVLVEQNGNADSGYVALGSVGP